MSVRGSMAFGLVVPLVVALCLSEKLGAPPQGPISNERDVLRPGMVLTGLAATICELTEQTGRSEVAVVVCRSRSSCRDSASLPFSAQDARGIPVIYLYPEQISEDVPIANLVTLVVGDPGRTLVDPAWYALAPLAVRVDSGGRVMRAFPLGGATTTSDVQRLVSGGSRL